MTNEKRLVAYDGGDCAIDGEPLFPNVKAAVMAGYRYMYINPNCSGFHVMEPAGEKPTMYWIGRGADFHHPRFPWIIRHELRRRYGY
jgi:hypothetical protein